MSLQEIYAADRRARPRDTLLCSLCRAPRRSTDEHRTRRPSRSEEELRAAYEEEIKRIRVEHVLLDGVVTLVTSGCGAPA